MTMFSTLFVRNSFLVKAQCKFLTAVLKRTMSVWEREKEKYLSMTLEEKRKQYAVGKFLTVQDIPTWKEYAKQTMKLAEKIPVLTNFKINQSLNQLLADKISVFHGDITTLEIDVIVNAANRSLLGGGGVDGAIHRAANHELLVEECMMLNGCPVGEAKLTGGYRLPAKYIIHTVGPQGEKSALLQRCYKNCLDIMVERKFRTIAFPCVSTGIYGYPLEPAAHIAAMEVRKCLEQHTQQVDRIIFCLFTPADEKIYQSILQSYFPIN